MLFFHASGFHSDVAWLQVREMATRQFLLGCCSHHGNHFPKKACAVVVQSPKCVWKEKGWIALCSLRAELGRLSLSILESLQKAKLLADLATSATNRPTAWQPLGNQAENVLQPSRPSWTWPGVTLVGWKSWWNFTQKLKWKNSFLYSPTLHSTLISTLKSFIEPWQLNGKLSCCSTERRDRFSNSCLISLSTWKWNRFKDLRKASEHLVPSNDAFQFPLAETGITLSLFY